MHVFDVRRLRDVPTILSIVLLLMQAALPWTAKYFVTMDGPSHLYTAVLARSLSFDSQSPYAGFYAMRSGLPTNWGVTAIINVLLFFVPTTHVEQALATLCVVIGVAACAYLLWSLSPDTLPLTPVLNVIAGVWFLWIGFYNFYLGMAFGFFALGYFIRNGRHLTWKKAAVLASLLLITAITHVLSAAVCLLAMGLVWCWIFTRSWLGCERTVDAMSILKPAGITIVTIIPALIVLSSFVISGSEARQSDRMIAWAFNSFPLHIFASSQGRTGEQLILYPGILCIMSIGVLGMSKLEWLSARGALALAAAISYFLYLYFPDIGFGGSEVKIRFVWCVVLLATITSLSTAKIRALRTPLSIYVAVLFLFHLFGTRETNLTSVSRFAEQYRASLMALRPGSTVLRVLYPNDGVRQHFHIDRAAMNPLYHIDAFVAAERRLVVLTDYQAHAGYFPVVSGPLIHERRGQLWALEGPGSTGPVSVNELRSVLPKPVDYVLVIGDEGEKDQQAMVASLQETMRPVPEASQHGLRVFQKK
ncbi:MAG TPA: hypothetical protein VE621_16120 [Bryobacteraceae bacterium]|nr:hypothetical protein [Bryobacteraceae bacterium]